MRFVICDANFGTETSGGEGWGKHNTKAAKAIASKEVKIFLK